LQVPNSCTDLDPTLLHILIRGTDSKFVRILRSAFACLFVCLLFKTRKSLLSCWAYHARNSSWYTLLKSSSPSTTFLKTLTAKWSCHCRSCGYCPSILGFLELYVGTLNTTRRDLEHNVTSSLPIQLFQKVENGRAVATAATEP